MVDELEEAKAWLRSKGTTLWGRAFDVQGEDPEEAARWFLAQLDSFEAFVENNDETA
jgi:hypothetical protein